MLAALKQAQPDLEMVWLRGIGHEILWEAPDRLTALISEFAASLQAASGSADLAGGDID
eukprot:CAMPEP_0196746208 /NCGR_PEP_ID=MMETSP1091-20130531/65020_1 /TAXON_ID=302021 /ORGANISM="Rhodomonas sp., Strain CCMP768" /LENGTH=58 /DNA_ID=CAMNT_0042093135 /DNA_START=68 /DNA_END=244 /DNA_ORIENTATION=-